MIPAERQKTLLNLISKQSVISINNLVNILGVSHMTVRRDIQKLEEDGKVISRGGFNYLNVYPVNQHMTINHY